MIFLTWTEYGNANVAEVVWTLTGLIGALVTWDNARDAKKYITALKLVNGKNLATFTQMRLIAFGDYRDELLRLTKFAIIVSTGIASMIAPPAARATSHVTPTQLIVTIGILSLSIVMVVASVLDRRQRELVLAAAEDNAVAGVQP